MSHKIAAAPSFPFSNGRYAYVDRNSTSSVADGSAGHPYLTIQAAIDARPTPASLLEALVPWTVIVAQGVYEENLVIPASGRVIIKGDKSFVGDPLGLSKNLSLSGAAGAFGEMPILEIENLTITGTTTITTAGVGDEVDVTLTDCTLGLLFDATGIVTATNATLTMVNGRASTHVSFDGDVTATNVEFDGALTAASELDIRNCTCNNDVTGAGTRAEIRDCSISGNLTLSGWNVIEETFVDGNITLSAKSPSAIMKNCTVAGTFFCEEFSSISHLAGVGTGTFTGKGTLISVTFGGLLTLPAAFGVCYRCDFTNVTVVDDSASFFLCRIAGTFTGPVGSFKVDGPTNFSPPALAGGATLVIQHDDGIASGPGSDTTAIHDDTPMEISALALKGSPVGGDFLIIEDSAAGDVKRAMRLTALGGLLAGAGLTNTTGVLAVDPGADATAIHDNEQSEISVITLKASPVGGDFLLIEDSVDTNKKKSILISGLPAATPAAHGFVGTEHTADTLANLNLKVSDATLVDTGDPRFVDARTPTSHSLGGAEHAADTLANLNLKVSDATLIDTGDSRLSDFRTPVGSALTGAQVWVGSAGNVGAAVALSGDATLSNAGALTIAANAVERSMMEQQAANGFIGNDSGGAADPQHLTVTEATALLNAATDALQGAIELATQAEVDAGSDAVRAVTPATLDAKPVPTRIIQIRLLDSATAQTTDTSIGGDFRMHQAMTVIAVGSYCDTAGVTSVYTLDIHEAGVTILSTPITVDDGEKTSETAATPAVISDASIAADAILTFDLDGIHSGTAANGLVVWLEVRI